MKFSMHHFSPGGVLKKILTQVPVLLFGLKFDKLLFLGGLPK